MPLVVLIWWVKSLFAVIINSDVFFIVCTRGVTVVLFIVILFCLHSFSVIAAVPMDVAFLMLGAALDLQASTGMLGKFTHKSYPWPI